MDPNIQSPVNTSNVVPNTSDLGSNTGDHHKKVGPIVATLVIVLILVIAAIYVFASRINQQNVPFDSATATTDTAVGTTLNPTPTATVAPVTGTADDPASLQKDLNASTQGVSGQTF